MATVNHDAQNQDRQVLIEHQNVQSSTDLTVGHDNSVSNASNMSSHNTYNHATEDALTAPALSEKEQSAQELAAHDLMNEYDLLNKDADEVNHLLESRLHSLHEQNSDASAAINAANAAYVKAHNLEHKQDRNSSYDDDEEEIVQVKLSKEEAIALAKKQPGLSNILRLMQILVFCCCAAAFFGYALSYNLQKRIDYCELVLSSSSEQIAALPSFTTVLPKEIHSIVDESDVIHSRIALAESFLADDLPKLKEMAGPFFELKAIGVGVWYLLAAFGGGLSLIISLAVYNYFARSRQKEATAFSTMYDVIRAEFIKYGLIAISLGLIFKFTELNDKVVIVTFVIMMLYDVIARAISIPLKSNNQEA